MQYMKSNLEKTWNSKKTVEKHEMNFKFGGFGIKHRLLLRIVLEPR